MRFLLTVAVLAGLTLVAAAQEKTKQFKARPTANSKVDAAPKSTAAIKAPAGATTTSATSKELRGVEREHAAGSGGSAHASNKAPKKASLKPAKERPAPKINFAGGKAGGGTGTRRPDPYKGRLKQKGSGH